MLEIIESGMLFEFPESELFQIEKSELYNKIANNGIKTVEFVIRLNENKLGFIEAKSSSPRPGSGVNEPFEKFIDEICDKFMHSFHLYLSAILGRHQEHNMSNSLVEMDASKIQFDFFLIIKGHEIEWLLPIKDAFEKSLLFHRKIWNSNVIVLNEQIAMKRNLITRVIPG